MEEARELGAELVLADRDIQATLKRTWGGLSIWSRAKLIAVLIASAFSSDEITEEELERLKERDTLSEMMEEFARLLPQVKGPLIDERDRYLMSSIEAARGETVVAVVGAGHVEGMTKHLGKPVDREALAIQESLLAELDEAGESDGYVHEEIAACLKQLDRLDEAEPHAVRARELLG